MSFNTNMERKDVLFMKVCLSEREIRVIRVALYKHWLNMTDDNAEANDKSLQDFADCCHDTWDRFSDLDKPKKSFDELDDMNCSEIDCIKNQKICKELEFIVNVNDNTSKYKCPVCGKIILVKHDSGILKNNDAPNFCSNCGQGLFLE